MSKRLAVPVAIKQLLSIVARLQQAYPSKRFTLDGRLLGDIGEVLAAKTYDLRLFDKLQRHHDALTSDGRRVQIKTTMQNSLTFPADHVPDYYLGMRLHPDGRLEEVFNGPGKMAARAVKDRKRPKTNLHSISLSALKRLSQAVPDVDRVPKHERGTRSSGQRTSRSGGACE
jgi:hypothetical protein